MPEPSPSAEFLDDVSASVREALAELDRHEASLADVPAAQNGDQAYAGALGRLEENLAGWQTMLGDMAERVRTTQDELASLDADLKQSLDAFAAARKYLEGS